MKPSLLMTIAALILSTLVPHLASASQPSILQTVLGSKGYKAEVAAAKKTGQEFHCNIVTERLQTQDYSTLQDVHSRFELVVLQCYYNPHDGGDAIRQAGLAVVSGSEVLSFTVGSIAQPD